MLSGQTLCTLLPARQDRDLPSNMIIDRKGESTMDPLMFYHLGKIRQEEILAEVEGRESTPYIWEWPLILAIRLVILGWRMIVRTGRLLRNQVIRSAEAAYDEHCARAIEAEMRLKRQ